MTMPQATALDTIRNRPSWLMSRALLGGVPQAGDGGRAVHPRDPLPAPSPKHLQLGLLLCAATHIALHLCLVHAIH